MNRVTFALAAATLVNVVGAYCWALAKDPYMLSANGVGALGFGLLAIASRD